MENVNFQMKSSRALWRRFALDMRKRLAKTRGYQDAYYKTRKDAFVEGRDFVLPEK